MKLRNKGLAVALAATLGMGAAGEAAADVYGLGFLDIDNLLVTFAPATSGGAGLYTFSTNADASLDGNASPGGLAGCGGVAGVSTTCGAGNPRLSGAAQNAPGGAVASTRVENDYTKFGMGTNYSNSESAIDTAVLLGDGVTRARQIAESNLTTGNTATADTRVSSNTFLSVAFTVSGDGTLNVNFDAIIDILAEVTAPDVGFGIAKADSSMSVTLADALGNTLLSWAPTGNDTVTTCGAGLVCTALEAAGLSLQNNATSFGLPNQVAGAGNYNVFVDGLLDGNYVLALSATAGTEVLRINQVPVPGTLFLMGAGLLLVRVMRRKA